MEKGVKRVRAIMHRKVWLTASRYHQCRELDRRKKFWKKGFGKGEERLSVGWVSGPQH